MIPEKIDPNDIASRYGAAALAAAADELQTKAIVRARLRLGIYGAPESSAVFGDTYSPPVIDGLLREREIMTLIAPSKVGKSFLMLGLVYAMIRGLPWLCPDWRCTPGGVIYIDNELEPRLFNARRKRCREALNLPPEIDEQLHVWPLWGRNEPDLLSVVEQGAAFMARLAPRLVIMDSSYYFMPPDASENSNADISGIYRRLYGIVRRLDRAALVLVHHSSKGSQADKDVGDVGAGAGAFARATGTHMILRAHEKEDCYRVDAILRSWPQIRPVVLRRRSEKDLVTWELTEHHPDRLRGRRRTAATVEAPDKLTTADLRAVMGAGWSSSQHLVDALMRANKWSRIDARGLMDQFIVELGLDEIKRDDGEKDCGELVASTRGHGGGLKLRAKRPLPAPAEEQTTLETPNASPQA